MWNKQTYRDTFSKVTASQELYEEVMNMPGKYQSKQKPRRAGRVTRNLLIAAAIAATLVVSVGAYAAFRQYQNPDPMLEAAFGENGHAHVDSITVTEDKGEYGISSWQTPESDRVPLNKELADTLVAPYLCAVEQSVPVDGATLTVEAYTYDESTRAGLMYYKLENPQGLTGYELQPNGELWWPDGEKVATLFTNCRSYIVPESTTDTSITLIGYFYNPLIPGESDQMTVGGYDSSQVVTLALKGFGGSMDPIARAAFNDNQILLSPFSLRILGSSDVNEIKLLFADGTEYLILSDQVANYTNFSGDGHHLPGSGTTLCFNRVIDPAQVTAIVLDGKSFPIQPFSQNALDALLSTPPAEVPVKADPALKNPSDYQNTTAEPYPVKIRDASPDGIRILFQIPEHKPDSMIAVNAPFTLEQKTDNGWKELPERMPHTAVPAKMALASEPDYWYSADLFWAETYGLLDPGTYRLHLPLLTDSQPETIEFTIESPKAPEDAQAVQRVITSLRELMNQEEYRISCTMEDSSTYQREILRSGDNYLSIEQTAEGSTPVFMLKDGKCYNYKSGDGSWTLLPSRTWHSSWLPNFQEFAYLRVQQVSKEQVVWQLPIYTPDSNSPQPYQQWTFTFTEDGKIANIQGCSVEYRRISETQTVPHVCTYRIEPKDASDVRSILESQQVPKA